MDDPRPGTHPLPPLPPPFAATREALRALACYVVAPARKQRTGRIGLRPTGDGFGTPAFAEGWRIVVRGDRLRRDPGDGITLTTLRAAAGFLDVDLSPDPGVGHDLPPYRPDDDLRVDAAGSFTLGAWYAFAQAVLDRLPGMVGDATVSEAQLWPEHFDLAVTVERPSGARVNVGFSPGDTFDDSPYAYVGPHDTAGLGGDYWNAPFGASVGYGQLRDSSDPHQAAVAFVGDGLRLLWARDDQASPPPAG